MGRLRDRLVAKHNAAPQPSYDEADLQRLQQLQSWFAWCQDGTYGGWARPAFVHHAVWEARKQDLVDLLGCLGFEKNDYLEQIVSTIASETGDRGVFAIPFSAHDGNFPIAEYDPLEQLVPHAHDHDDLAKLDRHDNFLYWELYQHQGEWFWQWLPEPIPNFPAFAAWFLLVSLLWGYERLRGRVQVGVAKVTDDETGRARLVPVWSPPLSLERVLAVYYPEYRLPSRERVVAFVRKNRDILGDPPQLLARAFAELPEMAFLVGAVAETYSDVVRAERGRGLAKGIRDDLGDLPDLLDEEDLCRLPDSELSRRALNTYRTVGNIKAVAKAFGRRYDFVRALLDAIDTREERKVG